MATKRNKQGFARMDPEKQRAIASKGGTAAHARGTAHQWTTEEAKEKMRLAKKDYIARNKGKSPIFYQFILL